jgi:hypothetical protein
VLFYLLQWRREKEREVGRNEKRITRAIMVSAGL